jgi:general secretion pathway protein G
MGLSDLGGMMADKKNRRKEDGYTLLEVLVVLGIIVLLSAVVGPRLIGYFSKAKHDSARLQLDSLTNVLEIYYMDVGSYPSAEAGLEALLIKPDSAVGWAGPYLKKREGLSDPWGRPYAYRLPGEHGAYDVFSLGRDGKEGGEGEDADIVSW